jgi:hypothetical protein
MVGRRSIVIGIPSSPVGSVDEISYVIDLLHVVGVQDLPPVPASASDRAGS